MKSKSSLYSIFVQAVCLLFVLLFVYAGASKLMDFENFQLQLGQSPLLSAYGWWVARIIPAAEIFTVLFLILPRFRLAGLFCSLILMVMFTAYIFIILNYSSFVPCSCGGVLAKMGWNAHLVFNIVFVVLAACAIWLNSQYSEQKSPGFESRRILKWICFSTVAGAATVAVLFISSENIMHKDNPFIRRFPVHPAEFVYEIDLKYNSYYFAGSDSKKIYLGNYTTPAKILSIDPTTKKQKVNKITLDTENRFFKTITVTVLDSSFYLFDGSVPIYLRGSLKNWKATDEFKGIPFSTRAVPIDENSVVFRSNNAKNSANVLGVFSRTAIPRTMYKRDLLQKQIDGIFDTDGMLLYSPELQKIIYLYYYRNEFIVADKNGILSYRGHTIDTIKHVKIKVASLHNDTERAMSTPSFIVNSRAAVYKNLLFVNSKIKGKFENEKLWERAYIIDVYELKTNKYLLSFPIYHTGGLKLNSFTVTQNSLYALIGRRLSVYRFNETIKKEILSR